MSYYNSRLKRGMKQKMFLLSANFDEKIHQWIAMVKGTTNNYTLIINKEEILCTCPDFTGRGRICKHLYFIIGRIGQCENMLYDLESAIEDGNRGSILTNDEYELLHTNLLLRLSQRINQSTNNNDFVEESLTDDCCICYEPLNIGPVLQCMNTCKNYIHKDCINMWLNNNTTCPLCRSEWANNKDENNDFDPLGELDITKTKINS